MTPGVIGATSDPMLLLTLADVAHALNVSSPGAIRILKRVGLVEKYRTRKGIRLFTPEAVAKLVRARAAV